MEVINTVVIGLEADCGPCNAADVCAADAEVVEFAVAHAAEFVDGFAILAPAAEFLCDVHGRVPFKALASSPFGADFNLMTANICCVAKSNSAYSVCHLCN